MSADPADAPLELPPTSARIERGVAALTANLRRATRVGEPRVRTFTPEIDTEPAPLAQVDPEPAHMSRLKVTEAPRAIERPDAIWDQLEQRTPQFFLRNTERLERFADPEWLDFLGWTQVRDLRWIEDLEVAHRAGREPAEPPPETASRQVAAHVAESRVLMVETRWHEHFGRPDPVVDPE